jgi:AraC-like DNA-binding protein
MVQSLAPVEMFAVRSGRADALGDVLDTVRLRSLIASRNEFSAPWGIRVPGPGERLAGPPTPDGAFNAGFYAITEGTCWMEIKHHPAPLQLFSGDVIVVLQERGHQLRDELTSAVRSLGELQPIEQVRNGRPVRFGGGGKMTTFIAGGLFFEDREYSRLLSAMPAFVHIPGDRSHTGRWLAQSLEFVACETADFLPGTQSLLNQISHMLFVQAIRTHVASLPPGSGNWLCALLDCDIGKVMGEIHARPHEPWTVASLADLVAMSRSAFAARFTALVGEPPQHYLSRFRLARATSLLCTGRIGVKQVANRVGFESEASFSKAFKRVYGVPPGLYRREVRATAASGML